MSSIASHELVRVTIANRTREADQQRLAHEVRRHQQPSPAKTTTTAAHAVPETPRHSRLWTLVHLPHAYS
jgi:hypothetical protein